MLNIDLNSLSWKIVWPLEEEGENGPSIPGLGLHLGGVKGATAAFRYTIP